MQLFAGRQSVEVTLCSGLDAVSRRVFTVQHPAPNSKQNSYNHLPLLDLNEPSTCLRLSLLLCALIEVQGITKL